jgi:outer membrane biosynthesis protein TonB
MGACARAVPVPGPRSQVRKPFMVQVPNPNRVPQPKPSPKPNQTKPSAHPKPKPLQAGGRSGGAGRQAGRQGRQAAGSARTRRVSHADNEPGQLLTRPSTQSIPRSQPPIRSAAAATTTTNQHHPTTCYTFAPTHYVIRPITYTLILLIIRYTHTTTTQQLANTLHTTQFTLIFTHYTNYTLSYTSH